MKIKSISYEKYTGNVYNFHCSPNENYYANNMLVHNCYKSNTANGKNMSFETFQKVITNINKNNTLTQVALGLDSTGESNPDLWKMCEWLRSIGIIPNGTVADISDETADKIAANFGACAVSIHQDKNECYNSVQKLISRSMKQVNIHHVIFEENYEETLQIIEDVKNDPRLSELNALVFLSLKKKGRATIGAFTQLSQDKFTNLVNISLEKGISIGFDSCSAHKFEKSIAGRADEEKLKTMSEPCESAAIFSSYINVDGKYFPCSFAEGMFEGIDVTNEPDFINKVWNGSMCGIRKEALSKNRECLYYQI